MPRISPSCFPSPSSWQPAVRLEALHGSRGPKAGTIGRSPTSPRWPGEASRLPTDHIVGDLLDLEDGPRALRGLGARRPGGSEGGAVTRTVRSIAAHLDWALAEHPTTAEPHDRISANPAAQIHAWYTAVLRFTGRDSRPTHHHAPCPRCEILTLFRDYGDAYIECRNIECGILLTPDEYAAHTQVLAAEYRQNPAA
ncbi:hypothetical protein [Streptomyces sp. UNOC14_S4]|uniref:hypothetical protein n=1 Tax=Streptomyces sp. UNOC14_S4 TaxID=2872340 RepID=UPI001E48E86A|nr:hypothetical protein [Streptomyces sp. UNOC14_S4]MCC3770180.1 hypothetical protein [Streptomyces sp. UNOC14_S4]